ncbi:biotin-dependent carboxyltransferase family protein [Psychromonas sp.]|uniref:5-oxoprolinase subunit C family protein n=1 Tax=Psychromonas sp. TaxID=1884585 RepID=UPI003565BF7B
MTLHIEQAGPLSLLQDLGRHGYQCVGVTPGGPMDAHAFHWANRLLDNAADAPQVEITMGPFRASFKQATSFSLCGADVAATLNGQAIMPWHSWQAKTGDLLEIGYPKKGLRTYLAVSGGFTISKTLGSVSTVMRDQFGGLTKEGKKLIDGDVLLFNPKVLPYCRTVPEQFVAKFPEIIEVGVLPTYQFSQFSLKARAAFFDELYTVTPQIDRMGYRLKGKPIEFAQQSFVSEGIALGAIQIPANGQPIVLMRDRQTIGGYPKMGCVCNRDLNLLAQATPGTQIRFFLQDLNEAEAELHQQQNYFFTGTRDC